MTTVRPARLDEYPAFARLFPMLGTTDPLASPERWASDLGPQTLFAERDGLVVGYLYGQALSTMGYVRHVVVAPEARGAGVGRALMLSAAEVFRDRGCERWCLNVRPDNDPALRLYRSLGMTEAYRSTAMVLAWDAVAGLPSPPDAPSARPIGAADDEAVEGAFSLPSGQLAVSRAQLGRVLLGLHDGERWVGAACFDPAFPGAFPFRVAGAREVRPLLEAMRPYALPGHDRVRAVIDDGEAVVEGLAAAGAEVTMRLLHLEGTLPGHTLASSG